MALPPGVHFLSPTLPVYVLQAEQPGPTAVIQAGIHGDEIAGVHALEELLEERLRPARGRLVVIPTMNRAAYRARERCRPGGLDLNRCFPGNAQAAELERRLARQLYELILDEQPVLVNTLHESDKRHHPDVPASFGQTIVYGVEPVPPAVTAVVEALNRETEHPYERWAAHHYPVATSSTEVIVAACGCVGVCVETWRGFDERRRIDMQRRAVILLLQQVSVLD